MSSRWGRGDSDWDTLVDETARFLKEQARLRRTTSYTELNSVLARRTGLPAFDFGIDRDRAAMGALLGEVAEAHLTEVGAMLSAIVIYLNENDAGLGFYRFATHLGLLKTGATAAQKTGFWVSQVQRVHDHFA
jgi:hypothetical protein